MQFTQITMNRHLNQAALEQIHAMLTNQVHRLPEAASIQR